MNSFWLDIKNIKDAKQFNQEFIQLIGTFTLSKGHMGMYLGTIVVDRVKEN